MAKRNSSSYDPNALSIFPDLSPPPVNLADQENLCRKLFTVTPVGLAFTSAVQHADGTPRSSFISTVARSRAITRQNNPARPWAQLRQQHSPAIFNDQFSNITDMFKNHTTAVSDGAKPIPPADQIKKPEAERQKEKINIKCKICQTPFFVPTSTQCGHLFCKDCITRAVALRKECPVCGESTSMRNLFRVYI